MGLKFDDIKDPQLRAKLIQLDREQNNARIRPVASGIQQPVGLPPLVGQSKRREKRKGRVAVVVTIIACREREIDDDNLISGCKWLRDAIACSLGLDDGDKRIRWEYGQTESRGQSGMIVKIELLEDHQQNSSKTA